MKKLILAILCIASLASRAQERPDSLRLYWDVDFATIFDNREGDARYAPAKTFFQTRLAPEIGASFRSPGAVHRIAGGVVWTQPIGSEWDGHRLSPTLYYRYEGSRGLSASLGMFGRDQLVRPLPDYIWSDSVYYCQRNIRGALLQYRGSRGYAEAVLDWRGMQSRTQREAFNIIGRGEWLASRRFMAGGVVMMNHLARSSESYDYEHVVDNFLLNPYVGLASAATSVVGWELRAGVLASVTRDRGDSSWLTRAGLWVEARARWKMLEGVNTLYAGGRLFPLYGRYGSLLDQGEPYYASPWRDRLSLAAHLIDTRRVALRASLDFNLAKDNFNFYQRLILSVALGSSGRRPRLMPL